MGEKSRLVTLIVALATASFGVRSMATQPKAANSRSAGSTHFKYEGAAPQALLTTLSDFDKTFEYETPYSTSGTCETDANPSNRVNGGARPMKWAIATVPDPERSNLKLDFDRDIEAIQNAAASAGYQFERFWFPWHTAGSESAGSAESTSHAGERRESDAVPGVMLFHPSLARMDADSLAIFLVGETPTSGINPGQFRFATCLGSSFHQPQRAGDVLNVIGPGYSASFDSLARLTGGKKLQVRSWTTDLISQRQFKQRTNADLLTTRTPSVVAINRFVEFLRGDWHDASPIVLLAEEGTALGTGIRYRPHHDDPRLSIEDAHVRVIEFPRNLSNLRNASEEEAVAAAVATAGKTEVPHTGLTLSLKDDSASFEIPVFSKAQTPVSEESVLFSISNLLKTGTVHYAGIIASDPLDVLYLSRYLRSACPNLRLFVLDPDMLFEHGLDSSDYEGVLSVTNYPLVPMSQFWARTEQPLKIFSSENLEAIYNAVLASLEDGQSPAPRFADAIDPINPQSGKKQPLPLWLTVAGRNGFAPIAILKTQDEPYTMSQAAGPIRLSPEYWNSWGYSFAFVLAGCAFFCFAVITASANGERKFSIFAVKPQEQGAPQRALCLALMGSCLCVLALGWLSVPRAVILVNMKDSPPLSFNRWLPLLLFCAGGFAVATALLATAHHRRGERASSSHWRFRDLVVTRTPVPMTGFSCSTVVLAVWMMLAYPEPFQNTGSFVLPALWHLFSMGSFVLGGIAVATACPAWDLFRSEAAMAHMPGRARFTRVHIRNLWLPAFGAVTFAVVPAVLSAIALLLFVVQEPDAAIQQFFVACRSLNLTGMVSPLIPFTLLMIVVLTLAVVHLKRIVYYEDHCPTVPYLRKGLYCPKLRLTIAETRHRTARITFHPLYAGAFVALAIIVYRVWTSHTHETLETPRIEQVLIYTAVIAGFFLLLVWIRVLLIWSSFSEFLQQLERHPLRGVFSLLPRGFVWSPVWQGSGKKRTHVAITRSLECILALQSHSGTPESLKVAINQRMGEIKSQVRRLLEISAFRRRIPRALFRDLERNLSEIAGAAADYLESEKWSSGGYELKAELLGRDETKDALKVPQYKYEQDEPATICGELIAFRFLTFINYVLWQLDNLVGFLSFGFLLLVIAMNSYEFRSRSIIDWLLMVMFVVLTAGIITVLAQAARDAVLSRITGTQEGKLDRNFFVHLISYGALPVLVLASTHFPSLGKFFFSWVKPALEAIH